MGRLDSRRLIYLCRVTEPTSPTSLAARVARRGSLEASARRATSAIASSAAVEQADGVRFGSSQRRCVRGRSKSTRDCRDASSPQPATAACYSGPRSRRRGPRRATGWSSLKRRGRRGPRRRRSPRLPRGPSSRNSREPWRHRERPVRATGIAAPYCGARSAMAIDLWPMRTTTSETQTTTAPLAAELSESEPPSSEPSEPPASASGSATLVLFAGCSAPASTSATTSVAATET
mmetsp:Transcript_29239/g.100845  ORF Transcript_29239/g.100845 Transcript_29239/m.100845 type:complete len:234 (+) Transcript_29239:65-766(+)